MFRRGRFPSLPLVAGAVVLGIISGKAIFGPPLEEYWNNKRREEEVSATATATATATAIATATKETDAKSQ